MFALLLVGGGTLLEVLTKRFRIGGLRTGSGGGNGRYRLNTHWQIVLDQVPEAGTCTWISDSHRRVLMVWTF